MSEEVKFEITPMNIEQPSNDPLAKELAELSKDFNNQYNFLIIYVDSKGHFRMKAKDENRQSILELLEVTKKTVLDSYAKK
jgi:hypothetical protein|tara:strand:- start:293 stop:535 length:243 start_codon:yes stop_codon:yes gene_type:complete